MSTNKLAAMCCSLLALPIVAGCSTAPAVDYGSLGLVDVTGTVTLDGQPLEYAVITFEDPTTSQYSYGLTDAEGKYTMQLDSDQNGVMPGSKVVRISTTRKILGLNSMEEGGEEAESDGPGERRKSADEELVPEQYNSQSTLTAEVSSSQSTFDFDLMSK